MAFPKFLERWVPTGHCNEDIPFDWTSFFTRIAMRIGAMLYGRDPQSAWSKAIYALDLQRSIEFIEQGILSGRPFMAGKIGTGDMESIQHYMDIHSPGSKFAKWCRFLAGKCGPFWWDNWMRAGICVCAGVFPSDDESIEEFCRIFMGYCDGFDAIATWVPGEKRVFDALCPNSTVIQIGALCPLSPTHTWYGALKDKKVLVVHLYEKTIRLQYEKHVEFHKGQGMLPEFKLVQYKPVNSIGGKNDQFPKWKDALDYMIADIEKIDFDVALLGCGVYGVPLSAHIKRMGRQAIYTGGATQAIFGIKGRRWDHLGIYNEHWIRPLPEDIPDNMMMIEGGTFL